MTDADLVERARQGDPAAFGELVERHRAAVYRAALAALRSPADADDAAQEAFLTAYRRLDGFRGEASFKTWLLTIAWHQAINHRRSLTRWVKRFVQPVEGDEPGSLEREYAGSLRTPEEALGDDRLRASIADAIRSLSPKLRDALLLAQAGEYSYAEIGSMLKAPVGTIKWRVSEARRVIRLRLRESGYSDVARYG